MSDRSTRGLAFLAAVALAGCDDRSSSRAAALPPPAAASASVPIRPSTVEQVYTLEGDADGQRALASLAQDGERHPSLRVAALRRLEELGAPETISVATDLAHEPPGLVRDNAVGTLTRLNAAQAIAGLDPDAQALARALAERAR